MRIIRHSLALAALIGAAGLTGCATPTPPCGRGEVSAQIVQLFFGRNTAAAPAVSEADWAAFVTREITPRFPKGLSVIDTAKLGRSPSGAAVHELGKAVVIILAGDAGEQQRLDMVRAAYKQAFSQESVLTARTRACVAF